VVQQPPGRQSRRKFLKATTVAGMTATGGLVLVRNVHAAGSDILKVALIGCGGRGSGAIRDCLNADPGIRVVALADAFEDRVKRAADGLRKDFPARIDLPEDRLFAGLDAYQKALDAGVDMIVTATPPGFRPLIYSSAVKAGKHVFMEKPCCVDAPGYRALLEANSIADEKGLKVGVGFQRRHSPNYLETIKRIHDGAVGQLLFLRAYYNAEGIWNRPRTPGMTEMQYQVNNWYHFCWLSGDNICEQHIHDIDVCNWVAQDHPLEANGMGGCSVRYQGKAKGTGQIFDHHFVEFTYKNGIKLFSQCRHIPGTWNIVSMIAHGTRGELNCSGLAGGERKSRSGKGGKGGARPISPNVQEHKDLIAAIRSGAKYNEGHHGATSSMTAVLGRTATYSGQIVKWNEAVEKGASEFPKTLAWDAETPVKPGKDGHYPIPVPGVYKAY
jgi:myo-inositol 2-dehydrogenase / D-chiro-inositol 1-dehydrogenase